MEIKNKEAFKFALRELVEKNIRQFPFYFWFNILINFAIIFGFVFLILMLVAFFSAPDPSLIHFVIPIGMFLYSVAYVTVGSFLKNLDILHELRSDHWGVDIKDYEWDHVMQFIEDLPMKIEDAERMKVSLSFGKLINLLDLFGLIIYEGETCDLDRVSRRDVEKIMERNGIVTE